MTNHTVPKPDDKFAIACAFYDQGDLDMADLYFEQHLKTAPNDALAWQKLGTVRCAQGAFTDGYICYARATSIEPDNAMHWTVFGLNVMVNGDDEKALHYFDRAITLDRKYSLAAAYHTGQIYLKRSIATHPNWLENGYQQCQKLSIAIPSRLDSAPNGALWLDRSIASVLAQNDLDKINFEIVVGMDPGQTAPAHWAHHPHVQFIEAIPTFRKGQSAAVNAAIAACSGDVVTMIEDDDYWYPDRLRYGLGLLAFFDFISSNQREVLPDGSDTGVINDFPTPCGWLMRMKTWHDMGAFDEKLKFHMDTDWLGRFNRTGLRRCHIIEQNAPRALPDMIDRRDGLLQLTGLMPKGSAIFYTHLSHPLIDRTIHPNSEMGRITHNPKALATSQAIHFQLQCKYGCFPW